jgi:hypothetical protein
MTLERNLLKAYCLNIHLLTGLRKAMVSKTFKAKVSKSILASAAFLVLIPAQASAQKVPVFHPGQWEVGSTQLAGARGLKAMKLPCIITTEYDNGYTVRFSGGGGKMLAMAIDFRQEIFQQGRKYNAMISIGDSYVKQVSASAFTKSTLIFNLRPLEDFYSTVKGGKRMEINVEDNAMQFNLNDLATAYKSFESCYNGGNAAPVKPMISNADAHTRMPPVAVPGVEKIAATPLPRNLDDIVQNSEPATAAPMKIAKPRAPEPVTPAANQISRNKEPSQWNARAGEDIKTVLSRWADRAGYDLEWQAAQDGKVAQDVALGGSFEEAVSQLIAENSAATGISGRFETAQTGSQSGVGGNWNAAPGASLQSVLDQWGAKAGVAVVWQTSINAPVKSAVNTGGNFETAVQSLLDQYAGDSARPVGRLNVDPQTGQRTLFMEMDRS